MPRLSSCFSPRAKKRKTFKPDTSYYQLTKDRASHARFPVGQRQLSTANVTDGSTTADNDEKVATHESIFHQTNSINPSADDKTFIHYSVSTVDMSAEPHGILTVTETGNERAPHDVITFPTKVLTTTWPSDVQSPGGLTAFDDSHYFKPKSFVRYVGNPLLLNGTRPIKEDERPGLAPDLKRLEDGSLHAVHSAHPDRTKTSIGVKSLAALAASDSYKHVLSSLQWSTPCA